MNFPLDGAAKKGSRNNNRLGVRWMVEYTDLNMSSAMGRNLTYGMLDILGKAIVTGQYDDQPFPTEAELAKHYEVSRSVVREAVKMLGAKGLLTARPRKGTMVQATDRWNLFDIDVLRWLLDRKFSLDLLRQFSSSVKLLNLPLQRSRLKHTMSKDSRLSARAMRVWRPQKKTKTTR